MSSLILGRKAVLDAIKAGEKLDVVHIQYGQEGGIINAIKNAAQKMEIRCVTTSPEKFKLISSHPNSQGVVGVKSNFRYFSADEILESVPENQFPLILILDSIQDPHNLGAILRTAECFGVHGVFLTTHNSAPLSETAIKISCGASSLLKICKVNNLSQAIRELKSKGIWIAGSTLENTKNISELDCKLPLALIVGNEEKGMRKLTADNCDFLVKILMTGKLQSLNVSVASGILLFEINRKRF